MTLGYLILWVAFLAMLSGSLYFALREWLRPEDNGPLAVDVEYARMEDYFGRSFRAKMEEWLQEAEPVEAIGWGAPVLGALQRNNGERILLLGPGTFGGDREYDELIFSNGALRLPAGAVFRREIYCQGNVETGGEVRLQAVAADGDVVLRQDSEVARWVDAKGAVKLHSGTQVGSRVTASQLIRLERGVAAQSLCAPLVATAGYQPRSPQLPSAEEVSVQGELLGPDTVLVRGDLTLGPGSRVAENLVVRGKLRTGERCVFLGAVKARGIELGPRNYVAKNIVSDVDLIVGESCIIERAAVAETDVRLARGARVGEPEGGTLAVVSAGREIRAEEDVAVHGKLVAGRAVLTI